jgi:UbiD family decarboxylase
MNFPEIVDISLPAEGVFHNLVFVSIGKTYPMQAYKIMHGQMIPQLRDQIHRGGGRRRECSQHG